MDWLFSLIEKISKTLFAGLEYLADIPWIIISLTIAFGLLYWLKWQVRYNKQALNNKNQLK